ncbi:MAG: VWA domain-containing protein [Cellvibrionaceae bacterium]
MTTKRFNSFSKLFHITNRPLKIGASALLLCATIFSQSLLAREAPPFFDSTYTTPVMLAANKPENHHTHMPQMPRPLVEVVFVLDTTGSMGGLIQTAKEKIWSIASSMSSAKPAPDIKIGLVAYRDRGDTYVTKITPLSSDLDSIFAELMDFKAQGGGDGPESVNQGLYDAVANIQWSKRKNAYKVIFLVGDAPPHMDYQDDVKFPASLAIAKQKNIVVNTIQCGNDSQTLYKWKEIAQLAHGSYFNVEQSGGSVVMNTPYDDQLANISRKLESTKIYYGTAEDKIRHREKSAAKEKLYSSASPAALARRAEFNSSDSGKKNAYGKQELLAEMESDEVSLDEIKVELLPEPMQAMSKKERKRYITEKSKQRAALEKEMEVIKEKRAGYIKDKIEKMDDDARENSLEEKIYSVVKEQGAKVGIDYSEDSAKF